MTIDKMIGTLTILGAWSATRFLTPKEVIRVTQTRTRKRIPSTGSKEFTVTIGRPNYRERKYLKMLSAAAEPFPVKKLWLRLLPKPKARG